MKLILEHPNTGIVKKAPVGFNLMLLLFPTLPPLFRGDIKSFFVQSFLAFFLVPVLIFPFTYNKSYIQNLLTQGYKVKTVDGGTLESASAKIGINLKTLGE